MPTTLTQTLHLAVPAHTLYAYITQPWRWHEWHPNSRSAAASAEVLGVGDTFDEVIEVQPLAPLPLRLRRETHYEVLAADPDSVWEVRGQMKDGWLTIRYELFEDGAGTAFKRVLTYHTTGPTALLGPVLRRNMRRMSAVAMRNLQQTVESRV